ncbi:MAG: YceI family protein [Bacteroidia bacterium]|nr:YceI family protein [Bacteroidia bacterium]
MKKLLIISLLLFETKAFSQIYIGEKCTISFFSETVMENIDATNSVTRPVFNNETGVFAVQARQTSFIFKSSFMQEHYNENYVESEKYPFATFKGKIKETIDYKKEGTYNITMEGTLDMHGVSLPRSILGTIIIKAGTIIMDSKFDVKVADYKIKVPSLYVEKIAEVIQVTFHAEMIPMKKQN